MKEGCLGSFWRRVPVAIRLQAPPKKEYNLRAYSVGSANIGNILSTFLFFTRKLEVTVSGGSTFARVKLKEIDGMAPQDVERAV